MYFYRVKFPTKRFFINLLIVSANCQYMIEDGLVNEIIETYKGRK